MNVRNTMVFPILLLAAAACSGADSTLASSDVTDLTASAYRSVAAVAVKIEPGQATVAVGGTVKLTPSLYDSQGQLITGMTGAFARWISSDTTVATVASSGLVHGIRNGVATIRAVAGSATGSAVVTVGSGAPTTAEPVATTPTPSTTSTTTTSAPTTTTTPTPTNAVGEGLSGKAFLYDDFTRYRTTTDLVAQISSIAGGPAPSQTALYTDGASANLVELDASVLYNGHPTMKYNQPGGTGSTPELWPTFPNGKSLTHMWFRAKLRWSPGYTTTGSLTNSANAYKIFGFGWNGNGRGELAVTNTTQYQLHFGVQNSTGAVTTNVPFGMAGNVSQEWSDGGWYDYIIEYNITSPTTATANFWMAKDGMTPVLRATVTGSTIDGSALPAVTRFMLGQNFNQLRLPNQNQALWYGQWEVVDGSQYSHPFGV